MLEDRSRCRRRIRPLELGGREVDADESNSSSRRRPPRQAATCAAGLARGPSGRGQDRPVLLGERDELVRAEEAAGRVAPADERLDAVDPAGRELDDRLVEDDELAAADAPRELRARARGGRRSRRASSARRPRPGLLPPRLRRVHRDVGVAEQLVGPLDPVAPGRDADARRRSMISWPWIGNETWSASTIRSATADRPAQLARRPRAGSRTRRRRGGPRRRRSGRSPGSARRPRRGGGRRRRGPGCR